MICCNWICSICPHNLDLEMFWVDQYKDAKADTACSHCRTVARVSPAGMQVTDSPLGLFVRTKTRSLVALVMHNNQRCHKGS